MCSFRNCFQFTSKQANKEKIWKKTEPYLLDHLGLTWCINCALPRGIVALYLGDYLSVTRWISSTTVL